MVRAEFSLQKFTFIYLSLEPTVKYIFYQNQENKPRKIISSKEGIQYRRKTKRIW